MLSLILASFMPQIKNAAIRMFANTFIGGTDAQSVRKAAKGIYKQLPGIVKVVSEETFVQYCVDNKDKIFPAEKAKPKKRIAAKAPAKNTPAKKAAKKVAKKTAKRK